MNEKTEQNGYQVGKTIYKAAPPLILVILCPAIIAALKAQGIDISEEAIYSIALGGYGAVIAFLNWFKNRKKKKEPEPIKPI